MSSGNSFRTKVEGLMSRVPAGKVTTYGDLASMAGNARAARVVGGIAHHGSPGLPWHRLVNRFGGLARGYHGGKRAQQEMLEQDGVSCTNYIVDRFEEIRWRA